jgi:hypothetical protein
MVPVRYNFGSGGNSSREATRTSFDSRRRYRLDPAPVAISVGDDARRSNPIFLHRDSAGTGGRDRDAL